MEKLNYKYQKTVKAQAACERALMLYTHPRQDATQGELEAYTASTIKHFELFFEVLWKLLKEYILEIYGSDSKASKSVFRESYAHRLINDLELEQLLNLVERRNTTTHIYDEETARAVCDEILIYFAMMKNIVERMALLVAK